MLEKEFRFERKQCKQWCQPTNSEGVMQSHSKTEGIMRVKYLNCIWRTAELTEKETKYNLNRVWLETNQELHLLRRRDIEMFCR